MLLETHLEGLPAVLMIMFIVCLIFGPFVLAGWAMGRVQGRRQAYLSTHERQELLRYRGLVAQIRQDAYDHMTLDSAFAVIVADNIRASEKDALEALEGSNQTSP